MNVRDFFIATKSKPVDIGLQGFTSGNKQQDIMRGLPQIFTPLTTGNSGSLPFTPRWNIQE
ncbi:hypothetical protein NXW10_12785 [Bacteroides fragilis]|uniref:hypothetical protein n=1 Tax=Phocaeicola coprocola TaxID=310298 RepID=UPI00044C3263|nr:hypothetical protein M069_5221 [Bacteroides fragilis str. B1 (UDC16-1)]UVO59079.1 hypothetical protein NXW10_12785 [Bacteroides fragilis]UVV53138.1 hypothetical protein NXY15_28665 [Bacteroides thetaiotaomicron]UVV59121.1 hypothetical protein NXY28_25390 [Bacteroides thetaiotaomicron]